MLANSFPMSVIRLFVMAIILAVMPRSLFAQQASEIPVWLRSHVGEGEGQIAEVVLQRARSLYRQKLSDGSVRNQCYLAMDATRPNDLSNGRLGHRFYVICEASHSFRAVPAGHGSGLDLPGVGDFGNGRQCARNFGNATGSDLTAGGAYVTGETKTSFKGYYRASGARKAVLTRSFVQFDGEGETANARAREIGGHATVKLSGMCLLKDSSSPYANRDGYVPLGTLVDYSGGRSNGCTSWSPSDASQIIALVRNNPTTLYIYPDAADVRGVARAVLAGRPPSSSGLYWNASCLREIRAPKFWSDDQLGPMIARYKEEHPAPPPRPIPICREQ